MAQLIECVPNFSEGRDKQIIDTLVNTVRSTPGVTVLDVDPGVSTNRTVLTFVGGPDAVVDAAFNLCKKALEVIDMSKHTGAHPRMGAVDVCPFVPVANITTEECVECAKRFGKRCGEELGIPIYLYEEAVTEPERNYRKQLKQIRTGEYEAIKDRIILPEWKPDFGPAQFVPRYGATVTGSRFFLVAYNINVLGTKEQAHRIALNLREAGRSPSEPGRLKATKAIGWYVDEYGMAQISMNLDNYKVTPLHIAFEEAKKDAAELKVGISGSEIVGLLPLESILAAADYYIKQEQLFIVDEKQKIRLVIERLGLSACSPFIPEKRIIEYLVKADQKAAFPLISKTVSEFAECVMARTPTPGGGSVAALIATLGASLGAMVGFLTYGKRAFETQEPFLREAIPSIYDMMHELLPLVDEDTKAYDTVVAANSLPKGTPEQDKVREKALFDAGRLSIEVPLRVMRTASKCWEQLALIATHGSIASRSDLEVGAKSLELGIWGAHRNVLINMGDEKDEEYKAKTLKECDELLEKAQKGTQNILDIINKRLQEKK